MEKKIHQIWVGPYEIPEMEKFFVSRLKELNPMFDHFLWTNENLPKLPRKVQEKFDYWMKHETYAFAADVLRIFLIREYGGLYLDIDWHPQKSFEDLKLENYDGLIVYHSEFTSGNEIFGSSAKKGLIESIYNQLLDTSIEDNHMPYWFYDSLCNFLECENTWNHPGHPHNLTETKTDQSILEFESLGARWLDKMRLENILALKKWGEFENVYAAHRQLHSWDNTNKEKFKSGDINYKDSYCFIEGYNK